MAFDETLLRDEPSGFDESLLRDEEEQPKKPIPTLSLMDRLSGPLYFATDVAEKTVQNILHPFRALESGAEAAATLATGSPKQLLVRPTEVAETSLLNAPHIPQQEGLGKQIAAGAGNTVIDFVNFMATPEGIASFGIGALPKAAQRTALALFGTQMAQAAPEQLRGAVEAAKSGDYQEAARQATAAGAGTFFAKQLGKAAAGPKIKVPLEPQEAPLDLPSQLPKEEVPGVVRAVDDLGKAGELNAKEAQKEVQGPVPVAQEPGAAKVEAAPELTLTPIVEIEGRRFVGQNHADAIVQAARSGVESAMDPGIEHNFLGSDGKIYTRKEAAKIYEERTGKKPFAEEGLHSHEARDAGLLGDVTEAREVKPTAAPPDSLAPAAAEGQAPIAQEPVIASTGGTAVGIAPPGTAIAQGIIARTRRAAQGFGQLFKSGSSRKAMDQTFDAADTQAVISGQQAAKGLSLGASKLDREAAMAIVESGGDRARLGQFLTQSKGNERATAAVQHAERNWDRLQSLAQRTRDLLDAQVFNEQNHGISTEFREDYVPHLYEADLFSGPGRPFTVGGGKMGGSFKKGRTFDTIFDAIEAGYKPKSMDVAELTEHRIKSGERLVNRRLWTEGLRQVTDPTDGSPLVADLQRRAKPGGGFEETAPPGYATREVIPGVRIAVHEGYSSLFDALTGNSRISGSLPGKAALAVAGGIKHGLLAFDTFHASRIMQRELFLTGKVAYKKGQTLLEYSDADLSRAVQENAIPQETADWVRQNRPAAELLIKNGLNVGRVQAQIAPGIIRSIKGIGTFNKWVFEKLTRGAIMQSGLIELERVSQAKPNVPREQVAREVARDLNAYFGNLGRQGVFKSRTFLDLSNLVALAPQWVESMARTEVKGALQTAKGLTLDPILHKTILTGSMGKGFAQGLMAYFVGTQLLNLFTRGKFTWDNEEKNHKLDAYIPDVTGKGQGFFISPFAVQAEMTHDMIRYSHSEPSELDAAVRIANNKASPFVRAGKILTTGKDWDRKKLVDNWDRVKAAAFALVPTPIPLSTLTRKESPPGSLQKQLTASMGFKTESAETKQQQMFGMIRSFLEKSEDPKIKHDFEKHQADDFGESDYKKLRDALKANDPKLAGEHYADLLKIKKPKQIMQAIRPFSFDRDYVRHDKPLTGTKELESKFLESLSDEDRKLYDAAKKERMELWTRFQKVLEARSE